MSELPYYRALAGSPGICPSTLDGDVYIHAYSKWQIVVKAGIPDGSIVIRVVNTTPT